MTFHVGQKVVYVGGYCELPSCANVVGRVAVTVGNIYTIREIDLDYIAYYGFAGIRVFEHVAKRIKFGNRLSEPAYAAIQFRPLIERKKQTDISIFTKMLDREHLKERA